MSLVVGQSGEMTFINEMNPPNSREYDTVIAIFLPEQVIVWKKKGKNWGKVKYIGRDIIERDCSAETFNNLHARALTITLQIRYIRVISGRLFFRLILFKSNVIGSRKRID